MMDLTRAAEVFVKLAQGEIEDLEPLSKGVPPGHLAAFKNNAIRIARNSQSLYDYVQSLLRDPNTRAWLMGRPGSASLNSNINNLRVISNALVNFAQAEDTQQARALAVRYQQAHDTLKRSGVLPDSWYERGQLLYENEESVAVIVRFVTDYGQKMES
jgi:hypothetical protein